MTSALGQSRFGREETASDARCSHPALLRRRAKLPSARTRSIRDMSIEAGARRGGPLRAHPAQAHPLCDTMRRPVWRGRRDVADETR